MRLQKKKIKSKEQEYLHSCWLLREPFLMNQDLSSGLLDEGHMSVGGKTTLSAGRWWILACYSLVAALQGMAWVVPGTLAPNYLLVYGMDQDIIQLLANYGCIGFILVAPLSMWALDKFGSRSPVILNVWIMAACNVCRCVAVDGSVFSIIMIHFSAILCAVAGPVCMAACSKIAEDWFPPFERTTATAIAALANQSGTAVVYLFVPLISPNGDKTSMMNMNYFLVGLSVLNICMVGVYFPSLPPNAPSPSALVSKAKTSSVTAASLFGSMRVFYSNGAYVTAVLTYSVISGLQNTAGELLVNNLAELGASQTFASWVGAAANLAAILFGVVLSVLGDWIKGRAEGNFKALILTCTGLSGLCFLIFSLCVPLHAQLDAMSGNRTLFIGSGAFILGTAFVGTFICLVFDLAAEHTFGMGPEASMLMGLLVSRKCTVLSHSCITSRAYPFSPLHSSFRFP